MAHTNRLTMDDRPAPGATMRSAPVARRLPGAAVGNLVGRRLADVERQLVLETMTRCGGNRTWAADILGLAAQELRDRLLNYNRDDEANARAIARREAEMEATARSGDGPRPTYLPPATFLA